MDPKTGMNDEEYVDFVKDIAEKAGFDPATAEVHGQGNGIYVIFNNLKSDEKPDEVEEDTGKK